MDANEQKARELLAAEYAKAYAEPFGAPIDSHAIAVRVIAKALAQQVPADGEWVLVPREATEAMLSAGHRNIDWCRDAQNTNTNDHPTQTELGGTSCKTDLRDAYSAMLAATPQAPQPVVDGTIGQQAVDVAAHEALTLLEQATCHDGRYGQMERIGWQESAQKLLPRLRAALAAHGKPNAGIHRAAEGRPVE